MGQIKAGGGLHQVKISRRHCKRVVNEAKEESWKKYGEQLCELCRHSPRNFYKSVKAMRMRDETYDPTTIINDQNGNPINDKNDIKSKLKEYFNELLNNTQGSQQNQFQFHPSFKDNDERELDITWLIPPSSKKHGIKEKSQTTGGEQS